MQLRDRRLEIGPDTFKDSQNQKNHQQVKQQTTVIFLVKRLLRFLLFFLLLGVSSSIYSPSELRMSSKFTTHVVLALPLMPQIAEVTALASGSSQTESIAVLSW